MLLFGYAFSWIFALFGLVASSGESAQAIGFMIVFPLTFVSRPSSRSTPSRRPAPVRRGEPVHDRRRRPARALDRRPRRRQHLARRRLVGFGLSLVFGWLVGRRRCTARASPSPPSSRPAGPGSRRGGRSAASPRATSASSTLPVTIRWSPPSIRSRSSQATHISASARRGRALALAPLDALPLRGLGVLAGEARRQLLLAGGEGVDAEAAGGAHRGQGARAAVEAGEHHRRVQRERGDRVRGRARRARSAPIAVTTVTPVG